MPSERLRRCLGPAKHAGTSLSQWVLNEKVNVIPQQTLRRLTREEILSNAELSKRKSYNDTMRAKFGDSMNPSLIPLDMDQENFTPEEEYHIPGADNFPEYDKYINSEVTFLRDSERF